MSGNKILFLLLGSALMLGACKKRDEDRLQEQELTQHLDERDYHAVLKWFDENSSTDLAQRLGVYRAYAHMGMGGLEPIAFAQRVRSPQTFEDKTLESFFVGCDNVKLNKDYQDAEKCLTVRLLNHVPRPDELHLRKAREVFHELRNAGRLSHQDMLLMSFVETCFVLARIKNSLLYYAKLDADSITHEQVARLFEEVHAAGKDMELFVSGLQQNKNLLTELLTGSRHLKLFEDDPSGRIVFVEKTGLPLFLQVTTLEDESAVAQIGRNIIIQVLDRGVEFFQQPPH